MMRSRIFRAAKVVAAATASGMRSPRFDSVQRSRVSCTHPPPDTTSMKRFLNSGLDGKSSVLTDTCMAYDCSSMPIEPITRRLRRRMNLNDAWELLGKLITDQIRVMQAVHRHSSV